MSEIRVDTISEKTSANGVTIDSVVIKDGGIDAVDATPSFGVYLSSDQTGVANNTLTKVTFNAEYWDTDSAFASNKFTVPSNQGGKYLFTYRVKSSGIDSGEYVKAMLYKNGSRIASSEAVNYSAASDQQVDSNGSFLLDLAATDYIEVYFLHTEGANQTIFSGTSDGSWFFGQKLGGV